MREKVSAPEAVPLKTPDEWCELEGNLDVVKRGAVVVSREPNWKHKAAAQCHGWNAHASHTADPLQISNDAYKAAIEAILGPPYAPVPEASSPYLK